jgi:hypothetical protein
MDTEGNPVTSGLEDIIVMIYNTVEIDPDLLQVKADYPHIGAEINQEVFFDIRDEEPIKTVSCDSEGQYSLSIPKGEYNICFYKEDYGYKLIHDLEVTSDQALLEVVLFEVISLSGSISDFTFENGKVYHITDDLIIPANSNVYFEAGTYVDVVNNKKIFMMDDFNIIENQDNGYIEVNSIYNNQTPRGIFRGFECVNASSYNLDRFLIKNTTTALSINSVSAYVKVNNSTVFNSNIGISTVQADTIEVFNCNIINNTGIGIDLSVSNNCFKNIIFNNNEGIRNVEAECDISDSYFQKNQIGVRVGFYNHMKIHHNEFSLNNIGVSMSGANPNIENNNFLDDNINIEFNSRYVQQLFEKSNPYIINNNIQSSTWQIDLRGENDLFYPNISQWGVSRDYVCGRNFWGVEKKIRDNNIINIENGYFFIIENEYGSLINNNGIRG